MKISEMSAADFPLIGDGLDGIRFPGFALTIAEGFCPYGHGPLQRVQLHGGCSWRDSGGQVYGSACVPGKHTCGVR